MNNTVRIALAVAYAAVGIWALMPTPPKPLAAATSPPPAWERPRYERPAPMPRPPRAPPEDMVQPDEYRGSSADEIAAPTPAALHPEPIRRPSVEMTPADLWAIANLKIKQLPPLEYDHYPDDKLVVVKDIATEKELRTVCNYEKQGVNLIGCADMRYPPFCHIYLGPIPEWTGVTRNINLRHELGHCNGWPGDHPGIR